MVLFSLIDSTHDLVLKFQGENFYKNKAIVEQLQKFASQKKCNISQVALAWVAAQGMIAIPVLQNRVGL
jgi:aryl-alcohol dehydrogenase-like predicted oxidoreductase